MKMPSKLGHYAQTMGLLALTALVGWAFLGANGPLGATLEAAPADPPGTGQTPAAQTRPGGWNRIERREILRMSPMPSVPPDPSNGHADDPAAAELGQAFFFDKSFSANGMVSCSSCHDPAKYFSDGKVAGVGLSATTRNTPSILGAAQSHWLFWDGRADSLWSQALGPVEDPREHGSSRLQVAHVIFDRYRTKYEAVFGPLPPLSDVARFPARGLPAPTLIPGVGNRPGVKAVVFDPSLFQAWESMTPDDRHAVNAVFSNFGKAVEAYERKLTPGEAPIDRFVAKVRLGDDSGGGEISDAALRGLKLFMNEGMCINCHFGPRLTNEGFHAVFIDDPGGIPRGTLAPGHESGAKILLASAFNRAGEFSDQHDDEELRHIRTTHLLPTFKIPSLRNVAKTAPYMHNGSIATLEEVIEHYNKLGRDPRTLPIDRLLKSLNFTASQKADLVAFLHTLTADPPSGPLTQPPG